MLRLKKRKINSVCSIAVTLAANLSSFQLTGDEGQEKKKRTRHFKSLLYACMLISLLSDLKLIRLGSTLPSATATVAREPDQRWPRAWLRSCMLLGARRRRASATQGRPPAIAPVPGQLNGVCSVPH
jgi:hypothetical protein